MKPRLLDLFCGAGGASMGYHRAGFDIVAGVDKANQPDYPFPFLQGDALLMLFNHITGEIPLGVDFIHASPPCQASSALTKGTNRGRRYPNLIPVTRELLKLVGIPFVIENVQGSEVRRDLTLCGEKFGLRVIRHRYFEVEGISVNQPVHVRHRGRVAGMRHGEWFTGPYFAVYGSGGGKGTVEQWRGAMGIDWTWDRKAIAEAVPPAYTEFIGGQMLEHLGVAA